MIDRRLTFSISARAAALASLLALGGCAGLGDGMVSGAFVDPAKYDLYDCGQLSAERKAQAARTADLQGLIDKAQTGTAGSVVGELAYRNDYISARASAKLAEENWVRSKCVEAAPAAPAAAAPPPAAPARKRSR